MIAMIDCKSTLKKDYAIGHSSGLVVRWKASFLHVNYIKNTNFMLILLFSKQYNAKIDPLSIYGPLINKKFFYEEMHERGITESLSLIIRGYLNLIINI